MNRVIIYGILILFIFVGCTNKKKISIPISKNDNNTSEIWQGNGSIINDYRNLKKPVDEGKEDRKIKEKL